MTQGTVSYSQCGEDLIILFLAQHVLRLPRLFYLDIGASHPVHFSNTYGFYVTGQRGICIEPNPRFVEDYRRLRPGDAFLQAGIGPQRGHLDFFELDPDTLSTFNRADAERLATQGHRTVSVAQVPVLELRDVLDSVQGQEPPNLLSLDVEGLDHELLVELTRLAWRPAIVCVETLTYEPQQRGRKRTDIIELMRNHRYEIYADTYINTIFVDGDVWEASAG